MQQLTAILRQLAFHTRSNTLIHAVNHDKTVSTEAVFLFPGEQQ